MILKTVIFILFLSIYISTNNVESFDLKNYRLPDWALPDHYYINIDLRNPEADTFRGYTWININVTEKNHYELVLNVDPDYIDINSSSIQVDASSTICDEVDYSNVTQIMALTCHNDMFDNNTKSRQFEIHYTAKFSATAAGLYKNSYSINGTKKWVLFTQFEPTSFRMVSPSFDEPRFKAPFTLSVDHYENLTVVSNMKESGESDQGDYNTTTFNDTPPMSSYLVAVVAGLDEDWEHTLMASRNSFYLYRQRIHDDYISVAVDNAPKLLVKMGEWTNIKYEELGNNKMTLAAMPGMGGAMENWGLIIFGEGYLIDEGPNRTTSKSLVSSLTTMAHEISHQWFGDYVTMHWWSETWLNEGFASYFEWYLADMLSTDDNNYEFDKLFVINELQLALQGDGPNAIPLSNKDSNVNTQSEIENSFSFPISYNKGGSVVRMLRYALGETVFQKGVQEYLKAKALSNAKASDLLQHLQAALPNDTDIDLPTYMDSWIHETGYPIVRTTFGDLGDYYLISMDIYKYSTSLNKSGEPEPSIWWVPISYITSDNPDPDNTTYFWINPGRTFGMYVSKDDGSWGVINAGARGLYRVDYDSETLARITNVLNNPDTYQSIATENRAQLLDDLFNIAKYYTKVDEWRDHRPYEDAFTVAQYLAHETQYLPWYTFLTEVNYLLKEIQDELTATTLKADVLALIEPQLIIPDPNDQTVLTHSEVLKRNLLLTWAAKLGHEATLAYVKTEYANFLQDIESVNTNYRDVVVCYGIKNSATPQTDYKTLMGFYERSILPQEKLDIVVGATCMLDSDLLKSFLASFVTDEPLVDKQYFLPLFKNIYLQSSEGLDIALDFLINNIDGIRKKWTKNIGALFSMVASKIVKQKEIDMLKNIISQNELDPELVKIVKGAIDVAEYNVEWIDDFGTEITSVLVYGGETVPTLPTPTTTSEEPPTTKHSKGVSVVFNMFMLCIMSLFPIVCKNIF